MTAAVLARRGRRVLAMRGPWAPPVPRMPIPAPVGPLGWIVDRPPWKNLFASEVPESHLSQCIGPGIALDIHADTLLLEREMVREFGASAAAEALAWWSEQVEAGEAAYRLIDDLPDLWATGFFKTRTTRGQVREMFAALDHSRLAPCSEQPMWMQALMAPIHWLSPAPESLPRWALQLLIALSSRGFYDSDLIAKPLRDGALEQIHRARGKVVEERAAVPVLQRGKAAGVYWEGRHNSFPARSVLWTERRATLDNGLREIEPSAMSREKPESAPTFMRVHERVMLRARALPVSFSGRSVVLDGPMGAPLLVRGEHSDTALTGNDSVLLVLSYRAPVFDPASNESAARTLGLAREQAWRALRLALPFCDEGQVRRFGVEEASVVPFFPGGDDPTSLAGRSPRTPFGGLYAHGEETWPALGLTGALMLAPRIASLVEESCGASTALS